MDKKPVISANVHLYGDDEGVNVEPLGVEGSDVYVMRLGGVTFFFRDFDHFDNTMDKLMRGWTQLVGDNAS